MAASPQRVRWGRTWIALIVIGFLLMLAPAVAEDPACDQIQGLDELVKPSTVLLVGELHGTSEIPALVSSIVCHAIAKQLPVTLGLELPRTDQPQLDAFLASSGGQESRAAFLSLVFWSRDYQDGRASVAMFDLIEQSRQRMKGGSLQVVLIDLPSARAGRDQAMADHLVQTVKASPDRFFVVLTGNFHSRVAPGGGKMGDLAAAKLPEAIVISLNTSYESGTAWICMSGAPCGVQKLGGAEQLGSALRLSTAVSIVLDSSNGNYDGRLILGPISASLPAKDQRARP